LSAVRWAKQHTVADVLAVEDFDEDDLYAALDWLASQQERIERELYQAYVKAQGQPPVLVLYDVTSSYFEGECNELGQYGYNRDGKRGKQQIVIGLLTAEDGEPLAVRVFEGNTADPTTVASQITILKEQFGIAEVVMVGDRGMIKAKGKAALSAQGFRYITALTDAQVRTFLKEGVLQTDLFDAPLCEVEHDDKRLIVRRNDTVRVREERRREDKLAQLQAKIADRNAFVKNSRRASAAAGLAALQRWAKSHKLSAFVTLTLKERVIVWYPRRRGQSARRPARRLLSPGNRCTADLDGREDGRCALSRPAKSRAQLPHRQNHLPGNSPDLPAQGRAYQGACLRGDARVEDHAAV
jgi:transposase